MPRLPQRRRGHRPHRRAAHRRRRALRCLRRHPRRGRQRQRRRGFARGRAAGLTKRVEFVAYTLEEPPHFKTEFMGSFVHARDLADAGVPVEAMISLEMLGFYSDAPDSQRYPLDLLKYVYPSRGDFIGVVSNFDNFGLRGRFKSAMRRADIPVESLAAPESLIVIAFSDHLNYWRYGWPAIMVTDTAFMRNKHYHRATDTPDTLDYARMKEAVRGVFFGVYALATR